MQETLKEMSDVATPVQLGRIADSLERLEVHLYFFLKTILTTHGFQEFPQGEIGKAFVEEMDERLLRIEIEQKKRRTYKWKGE